MIDLTSDWRTTVSGAVGGIVHVLPIFGVPIPSALATVITSVAIVLIGYFAKDAKVSNI